MERGIPPFPQALNKSCFGGGVILSCSAHNDRCVVTMTGSHKWRQWFVHWIPRLCSYFPQLSASTIYPVIYAEESQKMIFTLTVQSTNSFTKPTPSTRELCRYTFMGVSTPDSERVSPIPAAVPGPFIAAAEGAAVAFYGPTEGLPDPNGPSDFHNGRYCQLSSVWNFFQYISSLNWIGQKLLHPKYDYRFTNSCL